MKENLRYDPDYPSTFERAIEMLKDEIKEFGPPPHSDGHAGTIVGLRFGLMVLKRLQKNIKEPQK